nr:hypothetical protein [Staphylococcus pseudintermedius]
MEVFVNGERQQFEEGTTVQDILDHFGIEAKRMAVERNANSRETFCMGHN